MASSASAWSIKMTNDEELSNFISQDDQKKSLNVIFPGTKWCGSGNIATNYDDLGKSSGTDACCRAHDLCSDQVEGGGTAHGLKNKAPYTRLNCKCDIEFFNCLRNEENQEETAKLVGVIYFDVLQTQCYKYEYPVVKCTQNVLKRCLEYEYNTTADKSWQWFDVPLF
ncbi:phospholipase A2-like [Cimex lectularius]|uniref:Phospholipase A2 n=1 Tax=Cimex lectularius TaxID=79782 RepID=A0A8I6TIT6_CIMLE|nr:phospholipase A2-like [Cimex lectularius]